MKSVAVLAIDDVIAFDLAIPLEIFGRAVDDDGSPCYDVRVCGERPSAPSKFFDLGSLADIDYLAEHADTVIVPGSASYDAPLSPHLERALRRAFERGARLVSICLGAFTLAAAGLLDGRRATTHWMVAERLAADYPRVRVDPEVLFVADEPVLTSGGAAAGLDLCIHLVRDDFGSTVAGETARQLVLPRPREAIQAQCPTPRRHRSRDTVVRSLEPTLEWAESALGSKITVADLAVHAGVSKRTLIRRFTEQLRMTPTEWLQTARVRRAQALLETSDTAIESVADSVGFASIAALRLAFRKTLGVTPQEYRRGFG